MLMSTALLEGPYDGGNGYVAEEDIGVVYFHDLVYPLAARLKHIVGVVVVKASLGSKGEVLAVEALSGSPALVPECIANVKKWRFRPERTRTVIIVYQFVIEGLCNLPCPSQFEFRPPNLAIIRMGEPVVDHGPEDK
jgi:hypothetical protein